MILSRLRRPWSIFGLTILLLMSVVIGVTLGSVALVLFRPPPDSPPVTAYEVTRLIEGRPILFKSTLSRSVLATAPSPHLGQRDPVTESAIGHYLGKDPARIRFFRLYEPDSWWAWVMGVRQYRAYTLRNLQREFELYGPDGQFNPRIYGPFLVAVEDSGRWNALQRDAVDPFRQWQRATSQWILSSVLIAFPFALLFSRWLAKPIRAFGEAAKRIGRNQLVEPVKPRGPSEIRLAAEALNDMQARLQRYIGERTSVVGAIAHDLRTPLSRLNFHLESAPPELKQKAAAEIAEMEAMIAATLEFVQNEGRRQPREPIDLGLLVEGVVDDLSDLGHAAELVNSTSAVVRGDAVLLKRLFANLILNAVTYGNRAQVHMKKSNGTVMVDVIDEGPGLSGDDMNRAFEPFYRAEGSRNRSTGGIGLGLAIVQSAARAHGGNVTLSNEPAGGLRARVTLPVGT